MAVEVWYWFARDFMTTVSLTLGLSTSLAPEALHITDKEWKLLSYEAAVERLESWSHHEFPAESEQNRYRQEQDYVRTFRDAARVMMVASALAYGEEEEAQSKMNDKNWTVKVLQQERNVQAMLLMAKPELKLGGDKPVAILAFRGTELPDTDNPGQFLGDLWTNFNYSLTSHRGDSDLCAGTVAKGFLLAWRGLCPKNEQEICHYRDQRQSEVQFYVTATHKELH